MFRFLPRLAVQRPVLTTMLVMIFVVLGGFGFFSLRTDLFPEIDFPVVAIMTVYPGAGPEEIETQVTEPIEDAVAGLAMVDELSSSSRSGVSTVILVFDMEADPDKAVQEVRDKMEAVRGLLPADAEPPMILRFDMGAFPIMSLALSGPQGVDALFELADDVLRYRFARVDGVADVNVQGGRTREVEVLVQPDRLTAYNVALNEIVELIRAENLSIPAGSVVAPEWEMPFRVVGQYRSLEELRELRLLRPFGEVVRLADVAAVRDGFADTEQVVRLNGQPAVAISIQKRSDANAVHTAAGVYRVIEQVRAELPPGASLEVVRDESAFIRASVRDVLSNMLIGILLTTLVLFFFLHSWRGTIIAAVAMPATVVSVFLLMDQAGFTLNVLTLMALGITVGILVTNTIVVLESIYRQLDAGALPGEAAEDGTANVGVAVAASTLTNLVVFTPIAFMEGIVGQFFFAFGLTVVFATVFSIFISFTLAPLLAARLLRRFETRHEEEAGWLAPLWRRWDRGYANVETGYRAGLGWALSRPWRGWVVIAGTAVVAVFLIGLSSRFVSTDFLPSADEGAVQVDIELPPGTPVLRTSEVAAQAETLLAGIPEVESMLMTAGSGGGMMGMFGSGGANRAGILVTLRDDGRSTAEVVGVIRPLLADLPDAQITAVATDPGSVDPGGGRPFQLEVSGPDFMELTRISATLVEILDRVPQITDVSSTVDAPQEEVIFRPDRVALADYGLTVGQLGGMLRTALSGTVAGVYRGEAGRESDIRVRLTEDARAEIERLTALQVRTARGMVPLAALGKLEEAEAPTLIQRQDRQRTIRIDASLAPGVPLGEAAAAAQAELADVSLPPGYSWKLAGTFEILQDTIVTVLMALLLAVILTYIVLAMILESFIHPFTIMLTLPLGAVGAFLGLFVFGATMNILAMMALIMLVGIVVNNAILILDYAGQLRAKGQGVVEAMLEAAPIRLRPIIMSNIAIAVALVPQLVGRGEGAVFRVPMAAVTIGGVLVSAVFTLFLIPTIYVKMETLAGAIRRLLTFSQAEHGAEPQVQPAGD